MSALLESKPELLVNTHDGCGENPLYDDQRGLFYWCDVPHGEIYEWNPKTRTHRLVINAGQECGAFTLQRDGKLLLLFTGSAAILDPITSELTPLRDGITSNTGRFNDCIAKPDGTLFIGSVDFEHKVAGALFDLDADLNSTIICGGTGCSNGLAFTIDMKGLYWSDTTSQNIYLFDYDEVNGLSNRRVWLHIPELWPDGLTIDLDGNLWIAFWDGSCVRHYDSNANLIRQIDLESKNVTSCIFGGENFDELYITSAGGKDGDDNKNGALFRLKCEVGGRPEYRTAIGLN